jgi:hypothetical protein
VTRRTGGPRFIAIAALSALIFFVPWAAYQRFYDPPGNRLLKWHLAGVIAVDSRGFFQSVRDSYGTLSWSAWLHCKMMNFRALFTDSESNVWDVMKGAWGPIRQGRWSEALRNIAFCARIAAMLHLFQTMALLNFGWLGLAARCYRRHLSDASRLLALRCLTLGAICTAIWCLLMFLPGSTVNHQGTYFSTLCFMIGLSFGVLALPRWLAGAVIVGHIVIFLSLWVFAAERAYYTKALLPGFDPAMGGLFVAMFFLTLASLWWLGRFRITFSPDRAIVG